MDTFHLSACALLYFALAVVYASMRIDFARWWPFARRR
jgi:hypothetical protein